MTSEAAAIRISAVPRAAAMVEALRGLGYGTSTALADIIDNSISAGASEIGIRFTWNGLQSHVCIVDDGCGMSGAGLESAMRLGDRDPRETRNAGDLGRFGLGLKTASFSQCRRLTVASRQGGTVSCLRWDLDELAAAGGNDWHLLVGPALGSESLLSGLPASSSGTLVLWEVLDRVVTHGFGPQDLLNLVDRVASHLTMVFHRYLEGPRPRLRIRLNGQPVLPWDPFLAQHRDTWTSPVERISASGGAVLVRCHVLPHRDRLDARTHDAAAGPDGWTAQQGFYVYRHDRLLIGGSWLGLGRGRAWTKEEAHRLARISVDIPGTADAEWRIDVRKSVARPPVEVRNRLSALALDTRERARSVFAFRGKVTTDRTRRQVVPAWRPRHLASGVRYEVDETHPVVAAVLEAAGPLAPQIRAMLAVLQETVPVQRIWLDTAEGRETPRTGFSGTPPAELIQVLGVVYRDLVGRQGLTPAEAKTRLLGTEPFDAHPSAVEALPDLPHDGASSTP